MEGRERPPTIGPRLQQIRKDRGLTLDKLSAVSGVSRSMLSQIERDEVNPTLAIVWYLSQALGVELSEFVAGEQVERRGRIEITAASFVPEIRTGDGKCLMRILSPASAAGRTELYYLIIAAGGVLLSDAHARGSAEHLTVFKGELTVRSADTEAVVATGAIARYPVDVRHAIMNRTEGPAEALLVVMS